MRKNLGLPEALGLSWEVLLEAAAPKPAQLSRGVCCTLIFMLPCAEKLQMGTETEDVKLSWPGDLVPCNYSPYNSLHSFGD